MRVRTKIQIPVDAGNKAIKDGQLPKLMEAALATLKPEAAYFLVEDGQRTVELFFDLKDVSQIPVIVEPFFMGLNASVDVTPVMNADDLRAGLGQASKNF
jgi:hypothetical protein